jgi:hypothetical protein
LKWNGNLKKTFIIQFVEVRTYENIFTVLKKKLKKGSWVNSIKNPTSVGVL